MTSSKKEWVFIGILLFITLIAFLDFSTTVIGTVGVLSLISALIIRFFVPVRSRDQS